MKIWFSFTNIHWRTGGGGGGLGGAWPPTQKNIKPWLIFNSIQAYPYSTCRQVEISFLGMPQIAHFQVENEKAPYRGGDTTLPPLGRYAPSQRLRPPKCFGSLRHCKYQCRIIYHNDEVECLLFKNQIKGWSNFRRERLLCARLDPPQRQHDVLTNSSCGECNIALTPNSSVLSFNQMNGGLVLMINW